MKKKLFLLLCALLTSVGMWAAEDAASATYSNPYTVAVSNGDFENSLTGWTVEDKNAGFVHHEGNGGHIAEIYNKKNAAHYIKRTITGLSAGHYRLYFLAGARGNTDTDKVYAYIGTAKKGVVGEPFASYVIDYDLASDGDVEIGLTTASDHAAEWVAIDNVELKYYGPTAAYNTALNQAYLEAGSNMTSFIRGADFSDGISCFPQTSGTRGNSQTGSHAMESWMNNDVTYAQTIALPNGKYRITVDMISANDTKKAYLFASNGTTTVNSSTVSAQSVSGRANYADMCEDVQGKTLTIENFAVTNGSLTLGIKDPSTGDGWVVFDNFTLTAIEKDVTFSINNAAVTSATGWTEGHTASGQQYTGAPDNTYLDNNSGTKNMYQDVNLPAGYYLLKCATRASTNASANVYVYSYATGANVGSTNNHKEGNSGNLLDGGWAWTYVPFTLAEAGKVGIGFWSSCSSTWAGADDFHLTYYTSELAMKQGHLAQVVADANAWAGKVTTTPALETALAASAPTCSTVEECNTAISNLTTTIKNARDSETAYAEFVSLKSDANAIADITFTEITSGSHSTFETAISTQTTAAENATTAEEITTATSTLKAAIKAYINSAKPQKEGEYFDITCLIENPTFENNNAEGWSGTTPNAITYGCAEFFNMNFDFYQNITGLANGSYQLSVQAFCRPGDNGNNTAGAYYDYKQRINNITAELYVNSDASTIGNIYSYTSNTTGAKVTGNDFNCTIGGDNYWVPNNMQGASLYFADGAYNTTVAALVEDGNLKIGFREENKKTNQWVIFDNFRLYYYGSSKLVYYKQYLPQLKAEVTADLSNLAYQSAFVSSENEALEDALAEDPASETEEAYKAVIDDIKDAQTAFRAAVVTYDAIVAAKSSSLTKKTANIGTGVFQYDETTNNSLFSEYETAKSAVDGYTFTTSSTAAGAQALVDALNTAISNYQNQALNAPVAEKRYWISIVEDGKDWNGNAITFIKDGRSGEGDYAIKYLTTSNANFCQAIKLTATTGNKYKMSVVRADDGKEQYLTTNNFGGYGSNKEQIRTINDASKALEVEIKATSNNGEFQLYNTDANAIIANNNNNDMYTAGSANFTIAEASQATPNLTIAAGVNWATFISPFAVSLAELDNVTAFKITGVEGEVFTTEEVATTIPANTPVLLYRKTTGSNYSPSLTGWGTAATETYTEGLLTGFYAKTAVTENENHYLLQKNNDVVAFYNVTNSGLYIGAYRAYLTMPGEHNARPALYFPEDPTAINVIEAVETEANALKDGKYLIEGKIVIVKNGVKYDANGKKLN